MPGISRRNLLRSGLALSASSQLPHARPGHAPPRRLAADAQAAARPRAWPPWRRASSCSSTSAGSSRSATAPIPPETWASATARATLPRPANSSSPRPGSTTPSGARSTCPTTGPWSCPLSTTRSRQSHGYKPLGRRYPETSVGWYRREFDIPATDPGRRISGRVRRRLPRCAGLRQRLLHRPQRQRLCALPLRPHRFPRLRREELHRRCASMPASATAGSTRAPASTATCGSPKPMRCTWASGRARARRGQRRLGHAHSLARWL